MIDQRLHDAVRELDTATRRLSVPVPRQRRATGPLQAVAAAIMVVVAIGAVWMISEGSTTEQPVGSSAVSSPDEPRETPATTATTARPGAGDRHSHVPLSNAVWSVADPESVHEAGLASLEFDPLESGGEFLVLESVDAPMSELQQLSALLPTVDQPTSAVAIGAHQGMGIVYRAERDGQVSVCARVSPESNPCFLRLDGGSSWTTGVRTPPEPALWIAPEETAIVRFEDHGSTLWMIPIDDVVAFPWYFTDSAAHLTAFDAAGEVIGDHIFDPLTGPMTAPYPGPADVDLMRALAGQGSAVIAFGQDVEADTRDTPSDAGSTPYGELRSVLLSLNDGRTVPAVIVGQGDIGFAVVWLGADPPSPVSIPADLGPDASTIVDDNIIIVTRGVAITEVIEWWNTYIRALP
jgi:hypothetical protein